MQKLDMRSIAAEVERAGNFFFSRDTLRFFRDSVGNWDAYGMPDGRRFIRNARHPLITLPGGARVTLRGQWREVSADGDIGPAIERAQGMAPRMFRNFILGG